MVKFKNTEARTMGRKLQHKQLALVKKHFQAFISKAKQKHKGQLPASIYLAREYVDYLGARENLFAGIDSEGLTYKMAGFKQVYDHVRKRTHDPEEEKPPTPAATLPLTPKDNSPKITTPYKSKTKDEEVPAAATANGPYKGHQEEKDMPLRHHLDSEQEESDPDAGDQGFEEEDEEAEDDQYEPIGQNKFQRAKQLFIDLLDTYEEDELGKVTYEFTFGNANLHILQKDRAQFD